MLETFQREYIPLKILSVSLPLPPYEYILLKYCIAGFVIAGNTLYIVLQLITLYENTDDINMVFDIFYQCAGLLCLMSKVAVLPLTRQKIKRLCETVDNHWNIFTSKMEVEILKYYSDITRKLLYYYNMFVLFSVVGFITSPLTPILLDVINPLNESRSRIFPLNGDFRVDHDKYYPYLYTILSVLIVLNELGANATDSIEFLSIIHACGLFSIIGRQLEEIMIKLNTKLQFENEQENERILYQEYIKCLKKYQITLEFVDMINSIFQGVSLVLVLVNGAIITFVGILIINLLDQPFEIPRYMAVLIGTSLQLFISCYSGQKLKDESGNIFYRAYTTQWYNASPRLKSLLIITLYKSVEPCTLTAGGMASMSIETFGLVMRTAGSYFMTFLSLRN